VKRGMYWWGPPVAIKALGVSWETSNPRRSQGPGGASGGHQYLKMLEGDRYRVRRKY
jgi:hypothetical protein